MGPLAGGNRVTKRCGFESRRLHQKNNGKEKDEAILFCLWYFAGYFTTKEAAMQAAESRFNAN